MCSIFLMYVCDLWAGFVMNWKNKNTTHIKLFYFFVFYLGIGEKPSLPRWLHDISHNGSLSLAQNHHKTHQRSHQWFTSLKHWIRYWKQWRTKWSFQHLVPRVRWKKPQHSASEALCCFSNRGTSASASNIKQKTVC